jgi:hypothetical protein
MDTPPESGLRQVGQDSLELAGVAQPLGMRCRHTSAALVPSWCSLLLCTRSPAMHDLLSAWAGAGQHEPPIRGTCPGLRPRRHVCSLLGRVSAVSDHHRATTQPTIRQPPTGRCSSLAPISSLSRCWSQRTTHACKVVRPSRTHHHHSLLPRNWVLQESAAQPTQPTGPSVLRATICSLQVLIPAVRGRRDRCCSRPRATGLRLRTGCERVGESRCVLGR